MIGRTFAIVLSILLLGSALASSSAIFDLDESGGSKTTITSDIAWDFDEGSVGAHWAPGESISISGGLTDSAQENIPDYSINVALSRDNAQVTFEMARSSLADGQNELGDYSFKTKLQETGGNMRISVTGRMTRARLEEEFLLDPDLIREDIEGFKTDLSSLFNEFFASLSLATTPIVTITDLEITGDQNLQITADAVITDWSAFIDSISSGTLSADSPFTSCLGMNEAGVVGSLFSTDAETTILFSSINGVMSTDVNMSSALFSQSSNLQSLILDLSKVGSTLSVTGSIEANDAETLVSCLLSTEFPGTYTVTNLDYTFSKNSEGGGMQSLSVNINNFATQSGSNWQVSFPSSVTSDMDITVNIPSGLSIITVEGGEKTSDTSAVSTGGDFKVTYGKPGQDYTLWIIAAVIVIVLFALFRRKGKK